MAARSSDSSKSGTKKAIAPGSRRQRPKKGQPPPSSAPKPDATSELLDMDQVIELLKTTRATFYRWLRAGRIKGLKAGRQWRFRRADVDLFMAGHGPRLELTVDIQPLLGELSARLKGLNWPAPFNGKDNPARQAVQLLIQLGIAMRVSDVHVEPVFARSGSQGLVRFRIDGVLTEIARFDARLLTPILGEWKKMAGCDMLEKRPQDGRILLEVATPEGRRDLDIRCCFIPAQLGDSATFRFLSMAEVHFSLDRLDYAPADRARLDRALSRPNGLIVLTGPTGSGKTTVLYSALNQVIRPELKVMSIEDPVEVLLPGVTQIAIQPQTGLTFPVAMRAIFRSDPDAILVGEIRDRDMLQLCLQAALTGHLVLTTLHTDDAAGAIRRMVDIGAEPFLIEQSVILVSAQRLVRKLCPDCSVAVKLTADEEAHLRELAAAGGLDWAALPKGFRKAAGCVKCSQQGFRGRTLVCEMMEMSGPLRTAIRNGARAEELQKTAVAQGMTTMVADGLRRAAAGQTTVEEVLRVMALR